MKIASPLWSTFAVVLLQTAKGDNCACKFTESGTACRPRIFCPTGQNTLCDYQIYPGHGSMCLCRCLREQGQGDTQEDSDFLRDVATADQEEVELGADTYSFTVEFTSFADIEQATAGGDQLCIFKGTDKEPDFQPVWVGTMPALSTEFSWEVQYGVFATDQEYESGVTVIAKSWEDASLTGCYALTDDNVFVNCEAVNDDEIRLKNTKSDPTALWTMGLYQSVVYTGGPTVPGYTQPFFSKQLLANSGAVTVKPKQEVTVGMCAFSSSTLADSDDVSGACVITVDTSGTQVVAFDGSTNTFVCPSSSTAVEGAVAPE